jgi:nicotinamide phosphoribosyltransferase
MLEHLLKGNFILDSDGYKKCHWKQLPAAIVRTYTVAVPRQLAPYADEIVAAGQSLVASYLASVRITDEMIDEAEVEINEQGYEFNRAGWEYIAHRLDGKLPLRIMGVEEGRVINPQTPMLGWINTVDGFEWLAGDVETIIQCISWKMTTVASICRKVRKTLEKYARLTGTTASVDYMLHNFGDRGADAPEAAIIAGMAHAMIFDGSDCTQVNRHVKKLYGTGKPTTSSIVASEHYTMTSNSDCANKDDWCAAVMIVEQLEEAVARSKRGIGIPFVSGVIDTFDDERFVREYLGTRLKDRIIASGGRLISRPDSGDPLTKPGQIGNILDEKFGSTTVIGRDEWADRVFKVLHPAAAVIQGDGITVDSHEGVILGWINAGFTLDNFCLGMGSGVTHDGRRDDFSFSVKAIANLMSSGHWQSLLKDPKTDHGKKSLTGLARCKEVDGELTVIDNLKVSGGDLGMWNDEPGWKLWFEDGFRKNRQSWDEVKRRARA